MSSSSRKRKKHVPEENPASDPALYIQAHEADIIRGPQAKKAADSLEASGSALIQWNPRNLHRPAAFPSDEDDFAPPPQAESSFWVDRYDARLLLDALPNSTVPQSSPPSPSGWSDLPSDSEDTFFFSPDEADDYRQEKRRRLIDRAREERLRARREEDGEPEEAPEDIWGGSDEEPDEAQTELMKRTAKSIVATTNPAQLEMRILANYGSDKRFAFLRGRWKAAWIALKREAEKELKEERAKRSDTLGTLADYGDSDEEDSEEPAAEQKTQDDALVARQERAKAWAESRRAAKSAGT